MKTRLLGIAGLLLLTCGSVAGRDFSGREVQLRVMATSVPVRAGPGGSFQEIGRVGKGQVYQAIDRSYDGAWYRIRLARGITGWVLSDLVWPFEIVDEGGPGRASGWLYQHVLDPSHLADGAISLAIGAGGLGNDGLYTLRLGYQPSRTYMLELMAGQSVGHLGSVLMYGAEVLVCIAPWRSLIPFVAVGGGGTTTLPHREGRLLSQSTRPMLTAGGGLMLAIKGSFTIRIDARQLLAFSNDGIWDMLLITGGLMLSF